jgi:hypothetical protein
MRGLILMVLEWSKKRGKNEERNQGQRETQILEKMMFFFFLLSSFSFRGFKMETGLFLTV